jgi:hypothetical protein
MCRFGSESHPDSGLTRQYLLYRTACPQGRGYLRQEPGKLMEEQDFFNEKDEVVPAEIYCPMCRQTLEYQIKWRRRTKKNALPPRADERDRARFAKARNYRVRIDDKLRCKNPRCGRTIEISSLQTVVFD